MQSGIYALFLLLPVTIIAAYVYHTTNIVNALFTWGFSSLAMGIIWSIIYLILGDKVE